jgi:hypothetical protein
MLVVIAVTITSMLAATLNPMIIPISIWMIVARSSLGNNAAGGAHHRDNDTHRHYLFESFHSTILLVHVAHTVTE